MDIKSVPITDINPAPYNPRLDLQPGDKEYEDLRRSIDEFDCVEPLVWNRKTSNLVSGHQRLKILIKRGDEKVEVSVVDLEPGREKMLNLALNKIRGDWDFTKLADVLMELDVMDIDLDVTGFDEAEREEIALWTPNGDEGDGTEDEVPEIDDTPAVTKMGDLFQIGRHKLLCGDATKEEDVKRLMDGEKADMVFTDPPYGLGGYAGRSGKFEPIKGDNEDVRKFYNAIPIDIEERYIWGNWQALKYFNNEPRDVIIWKKENIGMGRGYRGQYELLIYFGTFAGQDSDVWEVKREHELKHPTQKPLELAIRAIRNSAKIDSIVLDLYIGSGTTLIACEKLKRICCGMEIEPKYCDVIITRFSNFTDTPEEEIRATKQNE